MSDSHSDSACPLACCQVLRGSLDELLTREWLITNGLGGYASSTVLGANTRRYHGLLINAKRPPLERAVLLSAMLEKVILPDRTAELATFEFNHAFHPQGFLSLKEFDYSIAPPRPWVQFVYQVGDVEVTKRLIMFSGHPLACIEYRVDGPSDLQVQIDFLPLLACRDFHGLRRRRMGDIFDIDTDPRCAVWLADKLDRDLSIALIPHAQDPAQVVRYDQHQDWWFNFRYRAEAQRGQSCGEDLFSPGWWRARLRPGGKVTWSVVGSSTGLIDAYNLLGMAAESQPAARATAPAGQDFVSKQLAHAADQLVVRRYRAGGRQSTTILAGYHWFGDWGRDTFIALPGLLLCTGRHDEALEVLRTFAEKQRDGLIPNRFSDYGDECAYNSIDASLWFVHAADQYVEATGDQASWDTILGRACADVVRAFIDGTDFETGVQDDGLVHCGTRDTQITWMDAKQGDVVFTPRHGKPVEINALWYNALCILTRRLLLMDARLANRCSDLAEKVRQRFGPTFWNDRDQCLFDCVREAEIDASIRPNQILAVSLTHSALPRDRQRAVVECVENHLLTPYGLRSLSPAAPQYRGRYEGDVFNRDSAYHQGTVWAWLIGPFIEAYLRVNDFSDQARCRAKEMLAPLVDHLGQAGLGSISEIFDGDPPHTPRGCIAQAWSVAEVLRARQMVLAGPVASATTANGAARREHHT
ncbi:MAG: glycogen debranching enzyme family protein [Phycisphaerae bacterium]|nr:glycogen debranching enzyme family protein [Phycisphaerae bacterium]